MIIISIGIYIYIYIYIIGYIYIYIYIYNRIYIYIYICINEGQAREIDHTFEETPALKRLVFITHLSGIGKVQCTSECRLGVSAQDNYPDFIWMEGFSAAAQDSSRRAPCKISQGARLTRRVLLRRPVGSQSKAKWMGLSRTWGSYAQSTY